MSWCSPGGPARPAGVPRPAGRAADVPPYLGGGLAALVALLGLVLGGLLTAVISIGVTRLLGTPVPSGFRFDIPPPDALAVPWPIYAFAAAPVGLLLGAVAAAVLLWLRYRRPLPPVRAAGGKGPLGGGRRLHGPTAGAPSRNGDDREYAGNRGAIAKAWAIGLVADDAGLATALAVGGSLVLALAAELFAAVDAGPAGHPALLAGWCARPGLAGRAGGDPGGRLARHAAAPGLLRLRQAQEPSAPCGTWARSGPGRCIRWPRPATPSGPCPRSSTGSGC